MTLLRKSSTSRTSRARVRTSAHSLVCDVGSGGHPHPSADVLVDRFVSEGHHRSERPAIVDRPFVCADVCALPFRDKAFDYVICNQVVEHLEQPTRALDELSRVGAQGFLCVPTEFGEFITPHSEHRWVFALRGRCLLLKRKGPRHDLVSTESFGGVFWALHETPEFKRLMRMYADLFMVRLEWADSIDYQVVDEEEPFYDYQSALSVGELLRRTPPSTVGDRIRDEIEVHLSLENVRRLGAIKRSLESLIHPKRTHRKHD